MSRPQLPAISHLHSLSEAASSLVCRIPELLHRLRDLQNEEAKLDAQARQLMEQFPEIKHRLSTPSHPVVFTPVSKFRIQDTVCAVDGGTPSTPHIDPRNFETPVKAFLLTESFALAMSVKSKRKGRIFLAGNSTEFGERR